MQHQWKAIEAFLLIRARPPLLQAMPGKTAVARLVGSVTVVVTLQYSGHISTIDNSFEAHYVEQLLHICWAGTSSTFLL